MQAPLRARFRDLPTVDMKEIFQQRMFEDDSYKAHTIHNDLYEDLQKSLELDYSNQRWDATGYEFKHDYTIIESPRAVVFPVNNNERKIMRFNEIYKFSDGTLTRILEILAYRVKEFKIKRLNLGGSPLQPPTTNINYSCSTVITSKILRVLRIILVVLPEHPSDTKVLTMKMEILLEPTSNKLLWVFNSLVHSLRALSTLRRFGLRKASATAKPCQGDSSESYLITGNIYTEYQGTVCEHAGPKVTTSHGGNTTTRMIWRFTVADDLKECSKIAQVNGTTLKDYYSMYKEINA
ncbi:hypothetical protein Tco_1446340 [Tanacetum coccineum]